MHTSTAVVVDNVSCMLCAHRNGKDVHAVVKCLHTQRENVITQKF